MAGIPRNSMKFFWWLRKVLYLWVRTKVVPGNNLRNELAIDPKKPVCYLMYSRSTSDLLVLEETCRRHKLPLPHHRPKALKFPGAASFIYLHKTGMLQVSRGSGRQPPSPLLSMVKRAEDDPTMEVQLVPVSVFWGRNPGKSDSDRNLFELLFSDSEKAGWLRKLLIVIVHGRGSLIHFGKPISLRTQVDEGPSAEQVAKKLRRVLRVHYISQRTAALGPSLPDRSRTVAALMNAKVIREAIEEESKKKGMTERKAKAKAYSYLMEISADTNHQVVKVFDRFLQWVWNTIFDGVVVRNAQRMRDLVKTHELVILPSHRSHMDYLLLAWSTYYQGLPVPHTAAGVNLNFWPVGTMIRKAGAFYIRRSFGGNRLYGVCFTEYVHHLLTRGHGLKFYIEGGRSRTGRLLPAKTGMLSMVVQSYYRNSERPIAVLPVYLGYDKVMEVSTYAKELRGNKKKSESISQLLKLPKIFRMKFGKAYIGVGRPLMLTEFLEKRNPQWQEEAQAADLRPTWHVQTVNELGRTVLEGINASAVVSPVALFSLILLSTPSKAMAEEELLYLMDCFIEAMTKMPYSDDIYLEPGDARDYLRRAMELCGAGRFAHPGGDVIHLDENDAIIMTYYRNNIVHLIAIPSLIASFMQHNDSILEEDLLKGASFIYPFLKTDYFLRWREDASEKVIRNTIQSLIDLGLLVRNGDSIARPRVSDKEFGALKILGRVIGPTLERYAISTAMLSKYIGLGFVNRNDFELQCQLMAQRISILNGSKDPEFFDQKLFRAYIDLLKRLGYAEQNDDMQLRVHDKIRQVGSCSLSLLSVDIRQSIQRAEIEKADNG